MEDRLGKKDDYVTDEERFRVLVEHVSDWIWEVNENGIIRMLVRRLRIY